MHTFLMLVKSMTTERSLAYQKRTNYAGALKHKHDLPVSESRSRPLSDADSHIFQLVFKPTAL